MRHILLSLFCLWTAAASAVVIGDNTEKALKSMEQGHIETAMHLLKRSAAVNDIAAQFYMGQCYELGIGLEADPKAAFGMYRRAAERGCPEAMRELARCYREGIGVDGNETRANEWQNRYAARNKASELPDIAAIYNSGIGLRNDLADNSDSDTSAATETPAKKQPVPKPSQRKKPHPVNRPVGSATTPADRPVDDTPRPDVDIDIPSTRKVSGNVFALIIANENYQDVEKVPNALNDGEIVAGYCQKVLGLPQSNIHLIKDATLNNIKREVTLIRQIAEAYSGNASFIVYYAGHGIPDESTRNAFLMPVDGYGSDPTTCYSLAEFYDVFGKMPSKKTVILLDACFSGAARGDGMLMSARGIAIKPKTGVPTGNTIVIASAQGDETAYPYKEKRHGLFTYFLLKKLKESRGEVSLGSLAEYLAENVLKKSLVVNGKSQTPTTIPSQAIINEWYNWKLN